VVPILARRTQSISFHPVYFRHILMLVLIFCIFPVGSFFQACLSKLCMFYFSSVWERREKIAIFRANLSLFNLSHFYMLIFSAMYVVFTNDTLATKFWIWFAVRCIDSRVEICWIAPWVNTLPNPHVRCHIFLGLNCIYTRNVFYIPHQHIDVYRPKNNQHQPFY
jgi:hypothetical protein